jgi:hypothetical protein
MSKEDLACLKNIIKRYDKLEAERQTIVAKGIQLEVQEEKIVDTMNELESAIDALTRIEFPKYKNETANFSIGRIKTLIEERK